MQFLIADTFTDSLARLTEDERKAVKVSAFDLQSNPANPGHQFHRIDKSKDKNFWSFRVNRDVRVVVHKTSDSLVLCYTDHHDKAYAWAERRRLETHPSTGAAQFVEIRETVQEIAIPRYVDAPTPKPVQVPLFATYGDENLLAFGVPKEWLADVKKATDDTLLDLADHLPAEAAEALLELATGGRPLARTPEVPAEAEPEQVTVKALHHPDAQRRFRVIEDVEELEAALEAPWDKWTIFLHPSQREFVDRDFNGPARVSGSAGTGKTVVAVHRAVELAKRSPESRVLLSTFSEALANILRSMVRRLVTSEPSLGERIDVSAMEDVGRRLYQANVGPLKLASPGQVRAAIDQSSSGVEGSRFSPSFLTTEWDQVVDAWQIEDWESYRDVARLGRRTRLTQPQRAMLWMAFETTREELKKQGLTTEAQMYSDLAAVFASRKERPYDFVVIDEAQDIGVAQLRLLAALAGDKPNGLFFAGDLGQRIFQQPFSWKTLGVDVRGRSRTLRVNYRTSHQIRSQADRLLDPEMTDVDDNFEERRGTVSVFNGPPPLVVECGTEAKEVEIVAEWLRERSGEGAEAHEIAVFVRSIGELERAHAAVTASGLQFAVLDERLTVQPGHVSIATMHLAKGLEFRAVAVMACDDEIIPSSERIETVGDEAELEDVYNTERQLLYVACTRAREHLLVTSGGDASEFLEDLSTTEGGISRRAGERPLTM
ncbi:MAG: 3'-5' exonuclease [Dehalococcoidia bacterium]